MDKDNLVKIGDSEFYVRKLTLLDSIVKDFARKNKMPYFSLEGFFEGTELGYFIIDYNNKNVWFKYLKMPENEEMLDNDTLWEEQSTVKTFLALNQLYDVFKNEDSE